MYQFKISSMNCISCFRNILDVLQEFDEDAKASVDLEKKQLSVDSSRPITEISQLIEGAGYPVEEASKL